MFIAQLKNDLWTKTMTLEIDKDFTTVKLGQNYSEQETPALLVFVGDLLKGKAHTMEDLCLRSMSKDSFEFDIDGTDNIVLSRANVEHLKTLLEEELTRDIVE